MERSWSLPVILLTSFLRGCGWFRTLPRMRGGWKSFLLFGCGPQPRRGLHFRRRPDSRRHAVHSRVPVRTLVPDPRQRGHGRHARPDGDGNLPAPSQRRQLVNGHSAHATAYPAATTTITVSSRPPGWPEPLAAASVGVSFSSIWGRRRVLGARVLGARFLFTYRSRGLAGSLGC